MNKYIHELRMGATKTFKTGAVVGTYPKPMLALMFDQAGLDIIPSKSNLASSPVPMNVCAEEIVYCKPDDFPSWLAKPPTEQPKVLAINFLAERTKNPLEMELRANVPDETSFIKFVRVADQLYQRRESLPYKSIVLDSVTGLQDITFSFISSKNSSMMLDARQWAFQIGQKVKNTCISLSCLQAHTVMIMHAEYEKNELTGMVVENPSVYSGLRNEIGCYFSQFFYALKVPGNIPQVSTTDYQFVRGLGMRWPLGLPAICKPDFTSLYGKEFPTT